MPPLDIKAPTIVHHMAAVDNSPFPPNSLEAIQVSLDANAAIIELDVTALARDDYLLVHDLELESETDGHGLVGECAPTNARELFYKDRDGVSSYHAAVLSDAVQLVLNQRGSTRLQLDFKNVYPLPNDEPLERLVELVRPLGERVLVSTGADWQLRRLRKLAPWLMLGLDVMWYIDWQPEGAPRDPHAPPQQRGAYGYYDDHLLARARWWPTAEYLRDRCESLMGLVPDVSAFYLEYPLIAQSLDDGFNWADALHARDIKLDAWTIDATNPRAVARLKKLRDAGVDLFTTNTPRALAQWLEAL
jgi:glycerophosphoryl diester phosphodiesterase